MFPNKALFFSWYNIILFFLTPLPSLLSSKVWMNVQLTMNEGLNELFSMFSTLLEEAQVWDSP